MALLDGITLYNIDNSSSVNYVPDYNPNWDAITLQINYNKLIKVMQDSGSWVPSRAGFDMITGKVVQQVIDKSRAELVTRKAAYDNAMAQLAASPIGAGQADSATLSTDSPMAGSGENVSTLTAPNNKKILIIAGVGIVLVAITVAILLKRKK